MLKKPTSSSPSKKNFFRLNSIENYSTSLFKSTQSICVQTDIIEKSSKYTNTPNFLDDMLIQGKNMNDNEFEKFIKDRASDCYWKILAERARIKLDDELRENRQLHELLEELTKENEQLQAKSEHCEYLTNVFNSMTSEYDSGIELHITDESPMSKRQKTHI
ncbi:unnamed protein product [Rotaria sordida]|uniref:Geminin n=1 Tax=Rotaria sordida TaxID=392033 RepID=A0A814F384_9BILA|nr:unnamed protein product [Rotaria sordida]CAF3606702.1 unnamed protein product [Rotaria sordida]